MTRCIHNFNPGPAVLPRPVLEQVQRDLLDYAGTGMSILEMSHRSPVYERIHNRTITDLRRLLACPEDYAILFMGGGAQTQFGLVAMNLLPAGGLAQYLVTGNWSATALREAQKLGDARELWSSAATGYDRVPEPHDFRVDPQAAYLHYTSNNTIVGTQFASVPDAGNVPVVCDMSSDLLSRPLDVSRLGLLYAGAQKNLGPAGVTVVVIRQDLLERCRSTLPAAMSYAQVAARNSLLNTPPVFAIYTVGLVTQYVLEQGGLAAAAARNEAKARLLYDVIDASGGFYRGCVQPQSRSLMNATFRLPSEALEARFVEASSSAGMVGLQGHRSLGGIRVSLYNAVTLDDVRALTAFMQQFQHRWG
jgi:phosphoserine aminotransferase